MVGMGMGTEDQIGWLSAHQGVYLMYTAVQQDAIGAHLCQQTDSIPRLAYTIGNTFKGNQRLTPAIDRNERRLKGPLPKSLSQGRGTFTPLLVLSIAEGGLGDEDKRIACLKML